MVTYASQTKTMLQSVSDHPTQLLRLAAKRDESKSQLPSKRKRETLCALGNSNKPFTIVPHPESPYGKPATFKPVRVIARSQLPLTFLDTSSDEDFASNRLFSAHIDVLERNGDTLEKGDGCPKVLIARFDTRNTLYAIERVQPRVYSICRLVGWLQEKDVTELWDPKNLQISSPSPGIGTTKSTTGEWWQHAVLEMQSEHRPVKRARMSMMRIVSQLESTTMDLQPTAKVSMPRDIDTTATAPIELTPEVLPRSPSPQEHLASLVQHYLDAVYLSKTSLAYFAKGPITRVRNAFTSTEEGAPPTHELVSFLRTMLLSPKASEKKYYEKLPALIRSIPPGSFSDNDESIAGVSKPRRSVKKVKLSREGIYSEEEAIVKKWWVSELPSGDGMGTETIEQRIKRRIGDLRVRETLAQLILMLEIVALEALSNYVPPQGTINTEDSQTQDKAKSQPKKRKRKLDDIGLQLDLLLDKLCIWHATEEVGILDFEVKPSKQTEGPDGTGRNSSNDRLQSFCVEVIIPFYINRLPEQALMVNKKLGGPAHPSPPKRKATKPPVISRKSKEAKEPEAKKSRRSLARVATDNTGRMVERVTPSLSRSATDSALFNGIKREGSEVPLATIPFQRSPSKSARQSMSQMRHLQGRQIDLAQPSAAATAKLKQKQRVEEDLQDAILALKKPNRGLAAGGYIADIEQRGLGLPNKSRKPVTTVRKTIRDVQVSATPRVARRTKNMVEQTPVHTHHDPFTRPPASEAPLSSGLSSGLRIPTSGAQPRASLAPATAHRSATARSLVRASIAETPSKAPNTKAFSSGAARRTIFATPSKSAGSSLNAKQLTPPQVLETPAKPIANSPRSHTNLSLPAIAATPTRPGNLAAKEASSSAFSLTAKENAATSIYDALGWNDDDDDLG